MQKSKQRRSRNRRQADPADPATPPTAAPIGPASGDLGGTYPNPTVVGLAHVAAGGDLGGTMDAPTVTSLAHVTTGPATYPAGDGSLLTNVPAPSKLQSNDGNLDGSGQLDISGLTTGQYAVGSWYGSPGTGKIITMGAPLRIASDAGATDAGLTVCWISF